MKIVTASLKDNYMTEIRMRHHDLTSDEPEISGGNDTGPNPYDLLMAALASCTAMTIRWYADRNKIDLTGCEVTLEYNRIHIKDCKSCAEGDPRSHIDHIKRTVEISGSLSAEQKERMLSIPAKCPVAKTLKSGVVIEDDVKYA
jgi:putative redox protein